MADLFTDGFEGGNLNAWDATLVQLGGSVEIASFGDEHAGDYSFHSMADNGDNACSCCYNTDNTTSTDYWEGEVYFKFDSSVPNADANAIFMGGRREGALYQPVTRLVLTTTGTVNWEIRKRESGYIAVQSGLTAPSSWLRVRFQIDASGTNPVWKLHWGTTEYTHTDTTSGTVEIPDGLLLGWYYANLPTGTWTLAFDAAVERDALTAIESSGGVDTYQKRASIIACGRLWDVILPTPS